MGLEDDFCDMIKKARQGRSCSLTEIARSAQVSQGVLEELELAKRTPTEDEVRKLSRALGLRAQPMVDIAIGRWVPGVPASWVDQEEVVITIRGEIGGYAVKGYLVFDPDTREAVLIDTGYNAPEVLTKLTERNLSLIAICLTHGHTDHAGGLDDLLAQFPVPVYMGKDDRDLLPWKPPQNLLRIGQDTQTLRIGCLKLNFLATPGHTPGGFCYRLDHEDHPFCFVGDTLFAGSVGRSNPFSLYPAHMTSVRNIVLALPDCMILFPGHGPSTTVQEERVHNPFAGELPLDLVEMRTCH